MELQAELDAYAAGMQSAGQCTQADEAEMKKLGGGSGEGSFPKVLADCGRKAYSWFRKKRQNGEVRSEGSQDQCPLHEVLQRGRPVRLQQMQEPVPLRGLVL